MYIEAYNYLKILIWYIWWQFRETASAEGWNDTSRIVTVIKIPIVIQKQGKSEGIKSCDLLQLEKIFYKHEQTDIMTPALTFGRHLVNLCTFCAAEKTWMKKVWHRQTDGWTTELFVELHGRSEKYVSIHIVSVQYTGILLSWSCF